jgi:hypothetical protein
VPEYDSIDADGTEWWAWEPSYCRSIYWTPKGVDAHEQYARHVEVSC